MSNNFLQFNPTSVNQESDAQYSTDAVRTGGAGVDGIFTSALANKLFYQLSTFVGAFAQALSNKGYAMTDASLTNLAGQLANVMTQADMSPFAKLASPVFSGAPTVPEPASGDNSLTATNTAWVSAYFARLAYVAATYQPALGFTPVQQAGGASQLGNKVYLGWDGTAPRIQIDATDEGEVAMRNWVSSVYTPLSDFALANPSGTAAYFRMPDGMIVQFGSQGAGTRTVVTLPVPFASGFYQVSANNLGPGGNTTMTCRTLGLANISSSQFAAWVYDQTGAASTTNISWTAIGY